MDIEGSLLAQQFEHYRCFFFGQKGEQIERSGHTTYPGVAGLFVFIGERSQEYSLDRTKDLRMEEMRGR